MTTNSILHVMLRVGATLGGVALSTIALLIPISFFVDRAQFAAQYHYKLSFSASIGVYTTMLVAIGLSAASAYLLLQYAIAGFRTEMNSPHQVAAERFFKSLAIASAAVITLAIVSQCILLGIVAIRLRTQPEDMSVGWSPQMWVATRDSPVFLALELVVFLLTFYWEYRRASRPGDRFSTT